MVVHTSHKKTWGVQKMQAVVIGASSESIHGINQAKSLDFYVTAFDGNPNAAGLKHADKSCVADIRNPKHIIELLGEISPDVVIPVPIGRYLTTTGAVNDHFNLIGISERSADICTDKHIFHETLSKQGMRNVKHILLNAGQTKIEIDSLIDYPFVVKPRFGSGNREVKVYSNLNDLQIFMSKLPYEEDCVIETFVEGTEYGIDAMVVNGKCHIILIREKILTRYPYRQCVGYYSVANNGINSNIYKQVNSFFQNTVSVLEIDNCLFHADIIFTGPEIFLIEISGRPSGHNLHNLFTPMCTGIDMVSEFLKFAVPKLGNPYTFTPIFSKCLLIKYFDLPIGKVSKVPDINFLTKAYPILAYECNIEKGTNISRVTDGHSLMGRGYFVIEGKNKDDLDNISTEIINRFAVE